jgi:hypothetical protein
MIRGMRDQRRCCLATLGDGASRLPEVYETLHASLIIWLGEWSDGVMHSTGSGGRAAGSTGFESSVRRKQQPIHP